MKKENIFDELQNNITKADIKGGDAGERIGRGIGTIVGGIMGFIAGLF